MPTTAAAGAGAAVRPRRHTPCDGVDGDDDETGDDGGEKGLHRCRLMVATTMMKKGLLSARSVADAGAGGDGAGAGGVDGA